MKEIRNPKEIGFYWAKQKGSDEWIIIEYDELCRPLLGKCWQTADDRPYIVDDFTIFVGPLKKPKNEKRKS